MKEIKWKDYKTHLQGIHSTFKTGPGTKRYQWHMAVVAQLSHLADMADSPGEDHYIRHASAACQKN